VYVEGRHGAGVGGEAEDQNLTKALPQSHLATNQGSDLWLEAIPGQISRARLRPLSFCVIKFQSSSLIPIPSFF
jgi:hypothetical protein